MEMEIHKGIPQVSCLKERWGSKEQYLLLGIATIERPAARHECGYLVLIPKNIRR